MGSSTALISPQKDVRDLIVELNDGFTAYYDRDLELCRASERLSQFAYGSLIPRILTKKDISLLNAGPIVVSIEKLIGYHCVLSATAIPEEPYALSIFSDNKGITKIAHDLPIGIINVDSNWDAVFVNGHCADMMKTSIDELLGRGWAEFLPENTIRDMQAHIMDKELRRSVYQSKAEFITPLGKVFIFSVQLSAHFDHRDKFINATVTVSDITSEHQAQSQLQYLADHDPLTELLNRSAFIRKVEEMDEAKFANSLFVFIDLDKFKEINDTLGHKAGDKVLQVVSRKIRSIVREHDMTARFGGDEFVICLPGIDKHSTVGNVAKKISDSLNRMAAIDGREQQISCSIGIAWTPMIHFDKEMGRSEKVQAMVHAADQGMYEVKKGGFSNEHFKIYDVNLSEQLKWLKSQRKELSEILNNNDVNCHYQPIYGLDGKIMSVEALIRFRQPLQYFKSIEDIITFAKLNDFDRQLLSMALDRALEGFAGLLNSNPDLRLNLNVDVSQLEVGNFTSRISRLCTVHKIPLTSVCVEITELMLGRNSQRVEKQIELLVNQGFLISMDDFGTGYSSFKRLMHYNFDELKIDRYFISNMLETDKFQKTLIAMIAMGKSLDLQILAEGVETEEQFTRCKKMGVHLFQGFYFSPPVDSDTLKKILNDQKLAS